MTLRNYSNTASSATAAVIVGSSDTSVALADYSGFPAAPYIGVLDKDTEDEEIVLVTNVAGSTVTVTRGYDGTLSKAHSAGASFRHVASAKDFAEANTHVNATSGAHGVAGALVGTTDEQTLTNKTLTSPTISNPEFTGTASGVSAGFSGTVSAATGSFVTLDVSGNGTVDGTFTVTGAVTLSSTLAAEAAELASADVTGNVTVGGTLGVTGALSGASAAFTGTASAAAVSSPTATHDEIELEQQATDPTAATGHSSLYAKTDGAYLRPNGQTARRLSAHWGSGATLPTTGALAGDTFYHSGLSSLLRYNGTNWRQIDGPVQIANMAARPTHADLHAGFQVHSLSTDRVYTYDGTFWRSDGTGGHTPPGAGAGDYITAVSGVATGTTSSSSGLNITHGMTFAAAPSYVMVTPGSTGTGTVGFLVAENANHLPTTVNIRIYEQDGSGYASKAVRINYTVIGYND